ncbi:MAG: hypothetical protein ACI910_003153 [Oleispira sp.]|jgi:hypothetical protein
MPSLKVQGLSVQLCKLLGVDSSAENSAKVASVVATLIAEIANENADSYKKVVSRVASNDPILANNINEGIDLERNMLVANLSALR